MAANIVGMQLHHAIRILRSHESDLKGMGVRKLFMFGSTARGEQRRDSDVDLFFDDDGSLSLFDVMDIKEATSRFLGCSVDIMTRDSINRFMRPQAEAEAVLVF